MAQPTRLVQPPNLDWLVNLAHRTCPRVTNLAATPDWNFAARESCCALQRLDRESDGVQRPFASGPKLLRRSDRLPRMIIKY